jgi:hypothetical protein
MTHTYTVVIEPAGRDLRRDSVSPGGPCQRGAGCACLQQLGGDGERGTGAGFGLGRLAVQVLAAS